MRDLEAMSCQQLPQEEIRRQQKERDFLRYCMEEFHRTRGEEWANGISHMVGVVFGIVALTLMMVFAAQRGNAWHVVSCAIYGTTLILLNLSSTLYHLLTDYKAKWVFQIFDHCSIYILIAGTYTPFVLVTMGRGAWGWTIFGIEWGLTVLGIFLETLWPKLVKYLSVPIYLVMGWLVVCNFPCVRDNIATPGLWLLAAGGLSYTFGVIFYLMDHTPYMHTVWHIFVLGGIVSHWVCITFYVIPSYD